MANWKQALGAVVVLGIAGCGYWAYDRLNTSRSSVADDTTALFDVKSTDAAAIKRGEYVMRTGDCMACHTVPGNDPFAGGYVFKTPFGTLLSSNITPDRDTGIGKMTERDFFNAVRHGQGSKGFFYPAMTYTAYAKLTDQDMHDLWAYMSTITPAKNAVDENAGMRFPYNIRLAMAGWNMLFFDNKGFAGDTGQSEAWNRGKYIVEGAGHCAACHSPRNNLGAEIASRLMQGGNLGDWYAPDITGNPHSGIGHLSNESIVEYLKTGSNDIAIASGPMAEAVENSTQYLTDPDLEAIATYLKSISGAKAEVPASIPASQPEMKAAALRYEVNCSACHGLQGEGIKSMIPAFAGNNAIMADDATNLIRAMLVGARAVATHDKPTGAGMPSFEWKMDDRQIAETLTYIRNTWGNAAAPVRPEDVAKMRQTLAARPNLATN
ncbi:cytochrome c [Rhizobium sp. 2MFCol3.1]|uniref:c-type cytochrome n=1 Tax=Rhizobium sp. 2MFCol3.1 TaxID=1246459 RepID=UPI00037A3B8C|nr:cytochrome c [Rhizobium sp. 2MFCol3.1]